MVTVMIGWELVEFETTEEAHHFLGLDPEERAEYEEGQEALAQGAAGYDD